MKIDIETAFLEGRVEEEIYIKLPEGLEKIKSINNGKIGRLNAAIYGLVQASRAFFQRMTMFLVQKLNFSQSKVEACLFTKKDIIIGLYVDDLLVVGNRNEVEIFRDEVKLEFKTREYNILDEFVGCQMQWKGRDTVVFHQERIAHELVANMNKEIKRLKKYETPGVPGGNIVRALEGEPLMEDEKQKRYRSCVGSLLYLTKYSRPDISNSVRELSKVIDKGTDGHYRQMLRLIKYVSLTQRYGVKFSAESEDIVWKLHSYVDSDFAGDAYNRKSVTGWAIYIGDCLIGWGSRAQKLVTISSTEAEYVAISEVCKEILHVKSIFEFIDVEINYPIVVYCDNVGAIFLSKNKESRRTKHIDVRYHFVRQYVESGLVKVIFVKSENNKADPFTKNVVKPIHDKHFKCVEMFHVDETLCVFIEYGGVLEDENCDI